MVLVATSLTVYGIETLLTHWEFFQNSFLLQHPLPFTVLKRREEENRERDFVAKPTEVAIASTVYGIETCYQTQVVQDQYLQPLQQYLPFTVLKQFLLNWILNF